MKRVMLILLSAVMLLTGCAGNNQSQTSGALTPDKVFGGATPDIDGYDPPASMMRITSQQLVNNIRVGWNLGSALDCCLTGTEADSGIDPDDVNETLWGNPPASQKLFEALVDNGVNAVRLPITWRDHMDEDGTVSEGWFNRVKQVVDYAYSCGMYVIITVYHDGAEGAWLRLAADNYDETIARYKYLWQQIAEKFRSYNERLLFESMNEVDFTGVSPDESFSLVNRINQEFVNTIRSSGGNNPWRHLLIAGYNADITPTCDSRFIMPEDSVGRCILSVHYYIPAIFCKETVQEKWGSNSDQIWMETMISQLKTNFTDKGIPAMITEYGARGGDIPSRVFFCEKLTKLCRTAGIAAFLWDDGSEFDRTEFTWSTPGLIAAIKRAAGDEEYTPKKADTE